MDDEARGERRLARRYAAYFAERRRTDRGECDAGKLRIVCGDSFEFDRLPLDHARQRRDGAQHDLRRRIRLYGKEFR